jgi:glycosyltransferase involved in cell wall biosynthesis
LPRRDLAPLWLEVLPHLDARYGGIATSAPRASVAAASAGAHRSAIAAFCSPDETPASVAGAVDVFPLGRAQWWMSAALRQRFRRTLADADAYHIHGLWQEHGSMTSGYASRSRKPYVVSTHGMLDAWALRNKGFKKRIYASLVERPQLRRAACLRALTDIERDDCRRFGLRNPIAVIPNGVDIPDGSGDEFLERYPELRGKRLVLFMGRIHYKKGPALLCRAWARIHRSFPDAHLVLAGPDFEDTARDVARSIAEDGLSASVSMPGLLHAPLTWSALRAAHTFVLPSYSEGLSRAVLEAMGCGVPVIVTHACNCPEVAERECGVVIDAEERALAGALSDMLRAPRNELRRMGDNGQRLVRERFSWDVVGGQLASLYAWVLGGGAPPADLRLDRPLSAGRASAANLSAAMYRAVCGEVDRVAPGQ